MRLDKYLADCGLGTRSEIKTYIKKGKVRVNAVTVTDPSMKIREGDDTVLFEGRALAYEEFRYFMLNKPQGCVSATKDGLSSTVLDILSGENTRDMFPVGRLDKDTEGLLLITNDGQLAHRLLSPRKHVDKTYLATVSKALDDNALEAFRTGLDIGDEELTLEAGIEEVKNSSAGACNGACTFDGASTHSGAITFDGASSHSGATTYGGASPAAATYEVCIHEGRYHQIKRMFESLGSEVVFLKRISMGPLTLDESLAPGEYRKLTDEEVEALHSHSL